MDIWIVFQVAVSAGLGAFVALERDVMGREVNMRAHALAGVCGCALALWLVPANSSVVDWVILTGAGAFAAGALHHHASAALTRIAARADIDSRAPAVDRVTFGGAFAIGAACGYGDVAMVMFVALTLAGVAMFRPQEAGAGSGGEGVAIRAQGRQPAQTAPVLTQEQAIADAAAQLAALAATLRRSGAGEPSGAWSPDWQALAPAGFARRRGGSLPSHNVAIRNRLAERGNRERGPGAGPLSREPSRA